MLCSGQEENIHLASQVLTLEPADHPTSKQDLVSKQSAKWSTGSPQRASAMRAFNFHLPYDVSCELVLSAAKEYFNSAGSLMDRDMDLARYVNPLYSTQLCYWY